MHTSIYWFRNDLRLGDNVALQAACTASDSLLMVYVRGPSESQRTRWGFPRWGPQRRCLRDQALRGLGADIARRGNRLLVLEGRPEHVLAELAVTAGARCVYCEAIAAPEERAEVDGLRAAGLTVHDRWQSSLLDPAELPFEVTRLPEVFTDFRRAVERARIVPRTAIVAPLTLPPPASGVRSPLDAEIPGETASEACWHAFSDPAFDGSEACALAHVERYFSSPAPRAYQATRNGLSGISFSTKFSPWLAIGALSPRVVVERLRAYEASWGANDGTYWIWFELLWRDFFRFAMLKHGVRLFRANGLRAGPLPTSDDRALSRWCAGRTGHPFVDAGLRELATTGYLSNRLRQVVASYLVHDLAGDWRAGAAWFESCLIDYDVYSNQGNWLYIAGRGADPKGGRRFDPDQQAAAYDPQGAYRAAWADPAEGPSVPVRRAAARDDLADS